MISVHDARFARWRFEGAHDFTHVVKREEV